MLGRFIWLRVRLGVLPKDVSDTVRVRFCFTWADSCPRSHQLPADHPQIEQYKQRVQLGGIHGQAAVAHLHVSELPLDDLDRVLDLGLNAGLDVLDLVSQRVLWLAAFAISGAW